MTLDERIQKDLTELYNGGDNQGEIKNAVALNGLIQAKPGQTSFATRALLDITQATVRQRRSW